MTAVRYKSSDGLEIPAYLTLPKMASPAKNLPAIILPHGGPWGRDSWGYDGFAQFLANRGYAVLQPNFRASTGYGKKFLDAGNKQWGDKMQDDLTWGAKYLIAQGIADPKRVGIMGGSYGGYATLAGVTFTPDLYAAGSRYRWTIEPDHAAGNDSAVLGIRFANFSTRAWAIRQHCRRQSANGAAIAAESCRQDQDAAAGGSGRQRSARQQTRSRSNRDCAARSWLSG